ncbi:hypothetical protein MTR_2g009050 [Medicago truncatula]|uniref:Uncharacterized protein n=1 Tax=Medicago truncatula TaxID=3880 RepID=G7IPJ7_MEDTR|nr:hypothetical protein MTR_2g009050 [Medicago truncatula]
MGLGVTQTILNKGQKRSEKNPTTRELMVIIQNLSSEVEQLKKERGKDIARSQQDMHILSDKDSSNVDVLKNIPESLREWYTTSWEINFTINHSMLIEAEQELVKAYMSSTGISLCKGRSSIKE